MLGPLRGRCWIQSPHDKPIYNESISRRENALRAQSGTVPNTVPMMPIKAVNIPSLMCCLQKECRPSCAPGRRVTKSDVSVRMPKTKHADNGVDSLPLYPRFAQSYVCHRRSLRQGSSRHTCPHGREGGDGSAGNYAWQFLRRLRR